MLSPCATRWNEPERVATRVREADTVSGTLLAEHECWEEALNHLRRAWQIKTDCDRADNVSVLDHYGWYHLLECILNVQMHLNPSEAWKAAKQMSRVAALAVNIRWMAEGIIAMGFTVEDPADEDAVKLKEILKQVVSSQEMPPADRISACYGIAVSSWTRGLFPEALEAILECTALMSEYEEPGPLFAHLPASTAKPPGPPLARRLEGGFLLLIPDELLADRLSAMIEGVLARRPELAGYASLLVTSPVERSMPQEHGRGETQGSTEEQEG